MPGADKATLTVVGAACLVCCAPLIVAAGPVAAVGGAAAAAAGVATHAVRNIKRRRNEVQRDDALVGHVAGPTPSSR